MAGTQTPITTLPASLRPGQLPSAVIENRLRNLVGYVKGRNGITVTVGSDGGLIILGRGFNGKVKVAGKDITTGGLMNTDGTKPWVKVRLSITPPVASEELGPPSDPWPDDEVWREKIDIPGTLYIDRV